MTGLSLFVGREQNRRCKLDILHSPCLPRLGRILATDLDEQELSPSRYWAATSFDAFRLTGKENFRFGVYIIYISPKFREWH